VMLELPLLPIEQAYGAAQRRQAKKFGVRLIPKHYFAAVLRQSDATIDGLHLSAKGHKRMAEMIWNIIGQSLTAPSPASHPRV
jgi:acyl-CoA thioesterase I